MISRLPRDVMGVVLCGGESTRMGMDKGMLKLGDTRWAEVVREKFSECQVPSVVSVNSTQLTEYSRIFDEKEMIVDAATLKVLGPLLGILSVQQKFPEKDLIVLACDMINMNSIVLQNLLSEFIAGDFEAITFRDEKVEPLCAIYSSKGLTKILDSYSTNRLQKFSMTHVLEKLNTKYLPLKVAWKFYFKNLNRRDDIAKN